MVIDVSKITEKLLSINVHTLISDSILVHEKEIVDLNRTQLWAGNDSNGKALSPEYHPLTIMYKEASGLPADRVTLFETGEFYESIFLNRVGDEFIFESDSWKAKKLAHKYGENIFGLAVADRPDAGQIIKQTLRETFRHELRR
jgi:hypothetical protein